MPEQRLATIFEQQSIRKIAKGRYLYLSDEVADKVYFVLKGRVKIGVQGEGDREITKYIVHTGDIFGEGGVMGTKLRHNFAQALEPVSVAVISTSAFKLAIQQQPILSQQFMQVIGCRLMATEQRLEGMVFKNSRSRIISFLHRLGQQEGQRVGYETLVRQFITHQEIANLTSTSRQTVTTVLNELRNANILTFNRKRLLIRDMDRLAGMA